MRIAIWTLAVAGLVALAGFAASRNAASAEPTREEKIRAYNEARDYEKTQFRKAVETCRSWCEPYGWSYGNQHVYTGNGCVCQEVRR